jgi:hypothetical protein
VNENDARAGYRAILGIDTNLGGNRMVEAIRSVTSGRDASGILARLMQAASPSSFDPAGAGGVLLGTLLACIGVGLLIGWAAGSAGIGALIGAVVGILAGTCAVYYRYRGAF